MEFVNAPTTQVFGANKHFVWQLGYGHLGKDWGCVIGTKAVAIAPGTVVWADWGHLMPQHLANLFSMIWKSPNSGICVVIEHDGWYSLYAHLDSTHLHHKSAFHKASAVGRNDVVGLTGNTGNSTGPHLHGEVFTIDGQNPGTFGRYNPDQQIAYEDAKYAAAAKPAPAPATPEGELTVGQITAIETQLAAIRKDQSNIKSMLGSPQGFTWGGKHYPSVWHVVAENQRRIAKVPNETMRGITVTRNGEKVAVLQEIADDKTISLENAEVLAELASAVAALQGQQAGLVAAVQALAQGKDLGEVERVVFEAAKAGSEAGSFTGTSRTLKALKTETTLVIDESQEAQVA